MKAEITNIAILITLPDVGSPEREPFVIWVNPIHGTWGSADQIPYMSRADTDFINSAVDIVCQCNSELTKLKHLQQSK